MGPSTGTASRRSLSLCQVGDTVDPEKAGALDIDPLVAGLVNHHMLLDFVAVVPDRMTVS